MLLPPSLQKKASAIPDVAASLIPTRCAAFKWLLLLLHSQAAKANPGWPSPHTALLLWKRTDLVSGKQFIEMNFKYRVYFFKTLLCVIYCHFKNNNNIII